MPPAAAARGTLGDKIGISLPASDSAENFWIDGQMIWDSIKKPLRSDLNRKAGQCLSPFLRSTTREYTIPTG